ncbi:MAG: hypothetical protein CSA20_07470 [Deltaproteobacteria bacterium]|nr:MAG: hypothetical protein CSA20_07470 [Deltaproteobacteria bacterium]
MKKTLVLLSVIFLSFLAGGCSLKGPKTTGIITHGEETEAADSIAALQKLAATDPAAAYDMGLRYLRGDGVAIDSYKGLQSLRFAGEHGDVKAQAALGKIYLTGLEEMGADPMEAAKWLRLAAEHGDQQSAELLKKAEAARKDDLEKYSYPGIRGWYWHAAYRLYWRHGAWYYH